ncbi:PR domain zinc finger protein 5-like isoform X1 [Colias croceus]|uniref:PR domain zinc finger protein 5-like isoform X1 n=1 Tax=Colias crocea TaxID=72248 RepID=UPI001E27CE33|nr:PR domain zinc finger protein 5-like isoform X1 [Colias croceus]
MEFDNIIVKENPGLCRCCLSEGCYKELGTEYPWMDETEVYADMLLECFDISISQHIEGPNGTNRLICEVCITRLRDACNFKKQVMDCEKKFVDMIGRGEFKKVLPIEGPDMKSELNLEEDTDVVTEIEYLEEGIDFDDDKDDPTQDITVEPLPVKPKRGRPKKSSTKVEKKAKEEKPRTSKTTSKGVASRKYHRGVPSSMRIRRNLETLFNNTSIIPFKFRGKYLCFFCSKYVEEYAELRRHTKEHGECTIGTHSLKAIRGVSNVEIKIDVSEISCEVCKDMFLSINDVIDHLLEKHKIDYDKGIDMPLEEYRLKDLACVACDAKFTFFGYLVSHVNSNHPKNTFTCDTCQQKFNKKRDLFSHTKNYHREGGFVCELCHQTFTSLNILNKHKTNRHMSRCNICFLKLPSAVLKRKHMKTEHPDDGSMKCKICHKQFHTDIGLKMHSRNCRNVDIIMEDNDIDVMDSDVKYDVPKRNSVKQLRENIALVISLSTAIPFNFFHNKFNCFFCSKDFQDPDSLKEHTIMMHPVCDAREKSILKCRESESSVKIDISSLACKICFEQMKDLDSLLDHLIAQHDANYDKSIKTCLQPYKLVKDHMECPLCPHEVFRFFGTLLKHMNTVHTDNKNICVHCGQSFRREQNLRVHLWRRHSDGKFNCSICGLDCEIPSRLFMHMAKEHGVKASKCPICPEAFETQYLRQKHLIEAHDSGHKCSFCGKLFTRESFLRDHVRRTHLKEKNVECSVCSAKFFNNILLRRHMVKHSGVKNFHCDVCGDRFYWKKSLTSHMAKHKKNDDLKNDALDEGL